MLSCVVNRLIFSPVHRPVTHSTTLRRVLCLTTLSDAALYLCWNSFFTCETHEHSVFGIRKVFFTRLAAVKEFEKNEIEMSTGKKSIGTNRCQFPAHLNIKLH